MIKFVIGSVIFFVGSFLAYNAWALSLPGIIGILLAIFIGYKFAAA